MLWCFDRVGIRKDIQSIKSLTPALHGSFSQKTCHGPFTVGHGIFFHGNRREYEHVTVTVTTFLMRRLQVDRRRIT